MTGLQSDVRTAFSVLFVHKVGKIQRSDLGAILLTVTLTFFRQCAVDRADNKSFGRS